MNAQRMLEGAGFEVKRPFPTNRLAALGPFILLDQIGPTVVEPGKAVGAPTHPHVGIETLTYFLEGEGMHLDSLGNSAVTGPGQAQWMRAGRGIVHDEGPTEKMRKEGGPSHAIQLWINMPGETKSAEPDYRTFSAKDFPLVRSGEAVLKVIAGELGGQEGPLQTFSKPILGHLNLPAGSQIKIKLQQDLNIELGIYGLHGSINFQQQAIAGEVLALFHPDKPEILLQSEDGGECLVLGGPRITEQLVRYGPFVTNSEADMQIAIENFQSGNFGTINR